MIIALDYDQTYTKDPELWNFFIRKAFKRGHQIICVTMRYVYEGEDVINSVGKECNIIFTGRKAKLSYLHERQIKPDVWIDDNPMWLYVNG